ncbi:serine/threonine-protein kinase [Dictyobacter kobayashii]|uniref:Protein kinase domain-containing protein n=1 Tax=Dictyobacter kobayashii TaxID=2014872 RepID=A0A402ANW9_9CHLR|nr:serine/threonine-protein kinase [Dictyobacter kobayashii]GCE20724.1 hypothetical protein KDK_45240 [Dictyobacter kobayashii]
MRHPHILALIDFGTHEGAPYIVKEYAPGGSLRDRLRQLHGHPLPLKQTLSLVRQIGDGLQFAHEHNVVHCDLKPENILFNADDEALIADFDIARVLKSVKTQGINIGGTPSYMAPEQFQGKVRCESDQYALACMTYEMVTGKRPFEGEDLATLQQKHLHEAPVPPSQLCKGLPQHIEQAILRGMEKKYTARFKDVATFVHAIDSQQHSEASFPDWPAPATAPQHGKRLILHAPEPLKKRPRTTASSTRPPSP